MAFKQIKYHINRFKNMFALEKNYRIGKNTIYTILWKTGVGK